MPLDVAQKSGGPVVVAKEGAGRLYYGLAMTAVRPTGAVAKQSRGFSIERDVADELGRPLRAGSAIRAGSLARVRVHLVVPLHRDAVAVEIPLEVLIRATTRGRFTMPAAHVEEMYAPEVWARSDEAQVMVQ